MDRLIIEEHAASLYLMDVGELEDEACFWRNYSSVSPARRAKIDSFRFMKDKRLSLGAGMLLARGLSDHGLAGAALVCGENGKPYLADAPQLYFNLSHSEQMVLAVFADVEAGCDVERIRGADLALARRFFCHGEYEYVAGQAGEKERNEAFYRIWTLKESFAKATGLGLSLDLDAYEIQIGPEGTAGVCQSVDDAQYRFREYVFGQYRAAVCFRRPARSSTEGFRE
ncbi:4'-phosphopantetheinyl transferase family protein [Otoolea muris]|uniref:4'-phosphopantetheinyl transferase family protein n=1 Tax=Otoolea muris TaxID=2941515 RepID=UPI00204225B4|nr:4'-phosphopantetheinyl transferase superfamily protein [Otoolea muris]